MSQHRSRAVPVLWVAIAAFAGVLAGACLVEYGPRRPEPPAWVGEKLQSLAAENISLREEIGRLRLELRQVMALKDTTAYPAPGPSR